MLCVTTVFWGGGFLKYKIFISFWLHWVFVGVHRLSLIVVSGGHSLAAVCGLFIAVADLVAERRL